MHLVAEQELGAAASGPDTRLQPLDQAHPHHLQLAPHLKPGEVGAGGQGAACAARERQSNRDETAHLTLTEADYPINLAVSGTTIAMTAMIARTPTNRR